MYCVSALISGILFYRWWWLDEDGKRRVWSLYGVYTGLMFCGSSFGVVTWVAWMQFLVNFFKGENFITNGNRPEWMKSFAQAYNWRVVFTITYATEFLCLSVALLMVLDRMSDFAATSKADTAFKRWVVGSRLVLSTVVLGNAVGLAGNIAAALSFRQVAVFADSSYNAFAANNLQEGVRLFTEGSSHAQTALHVASFQSFSEVCVLLLIVAAFIVAGIACARLITSRLLSVEHSSMAAATGRTLWLRMVGTTAFVFAAFLLRSIFSTLYAVAYLYQDVEATTQPLPRLCSSNTNPLFKCDACYSVYTHISQWLVRTPEFQLTVVLISSPLALLVALWGMTTSITLKLMRTNRRQKMFPSDVSTSASETVVMTLTK